MNRYFFCAIVAVFWMAGFALAVDSNNKGYPSAKDSSDVIEYTLIPPRAIANSVTTTNPPISFLLNESFIYAPKNNINNAQLHLMWFER